MPAPYSLDLRERVIAAYDPERETYASVAARFAVGVATVDRWVSRHRKRGSVRPDAMGGDRHSKFDAESEARLCAMVEADPDATRVELVEKLRVEVGLTVSSSAVQRALERLGLSRKKRRSTLLNATLNE